MVDNINFNELWPIQEMIRQQRQAQGQGQHSQTDSVTVERAYHGAEAQRPGMVKTTSETHHSHRFFDLMMLIPSPTPSKIT